ncbi:MAG TPA: hypothetical protein VM487_15955 [Phycisphaerae bacterium]|nr:hypothetical protein [Phycisphaerae bacterium]
MGAEMIWPLVKGLVALVALFGVIKYVERGGAAKNERDALKGAERGRLKFEDELLENREEAVERWRKRREAARARASAAASAARVSDD